jgi:hypothetical protein
MAAARHAIGVDQDRLQAKRAKKLEEARKDCS